MRHAVVVLLVYSCATIMGASRARAEAACGTEGQACCATGDPCTGELGCAGGKCKSIITNMVAYANYCKRQLGFTNPDAKMPYVSCFDSPAPGGGRAPTGRQVDIKLTLQDGAAATTHHLKDNGPVVRDGKDVWDLVYGSESAAHGCDNPNYLYGACDPYYRLNVWKPDPQNDKIVAALHCRDGGYTKPQPANAITAQARLQAFLDARDSSATLDEKTRLFDQWNGTSEIVLIMANLDSGKACFFHAARPYFGSHVPAPDDERTLTPEQTWDELPVKPPFPITDTRRHAEWKRTGADAWYAPNYMACTSCHDSGPFLHDPFIDSMDDGAVPFLPHDSRRRPYLPLGYQAQTSVKYVKTDRVRTPEGEQPQLCTSCHSLGAANACSSWFDRALGWDMPYSASEASKQIETIHRYMPLHHTNSTAEFYAKYGNHVDAMKCCCEHSDWRGCATVNRATPTDPGTPGTGAQSCTASTTGGWKQPCTGGTSCNHSGLACRSGTCRFVDEPAFD